MDLKIAVRRVWRGLTSTATRFRARVLCLAWLLIYTAAHALVGTQYQMVLGNPSGV